MSDTACAEPNIFSHMRNVSSNGLSRSNPCPYNDSSILRPGAKGRGQQRSVIRPQPWRSETLAQSAGPSGRFKDFLAIISAAPVEAERIVGRSKRVPPQPNTEAHPRTPTFASRTDSIPSPGYIISKRYRHCTGLRPPGGSRNRKWILSNWEYRYLVRITA